MMVSEIRCSSLHRYMNCPGYASLTDLPEDEGNPAAAEGTAAGELLTAMIRQQSLTPNVGHVASNGVQFDNDMYFYVTPLAKFALDESQATATTEERIDWMTRAGILIRGQYDVSYIKGNDLHVLDLKYGYRIVEPENNWQLIGYSIGQVIKHQRAFDNIHLTIYQPRPYHENNIQRAWVVPYSRLVELKEEIESMTLALASGESPMKTSPSCKYCLGAASCGALHRAAMSAVDIALGKAIQDHLSDSELSKQLDLLDRAKELINIRRDSLGELAISRIRKGEIVPNYAIEERQGDRTWRQGVTAEVLNSMFGKPAQEVKIMSPAQYEKLGIDKSFMNGLTERRRIGTKVVRRDMSAFADKIFNNKGSN